MYPLPQRPVPDLTLALPVNRQDLYYYIVHKKPTMRTHSDCSNGRRHIDGILNRLNKTHSTLMKNESRIWLLRSLADRGLCTRDVYYFAYNQAKIRSFYKVLDKQTIRSATQAELRDLRLSLTSTLKLKKQ